MHCFFSLILMFVLSMVARVARLPIGKSDSLLFPNPVISVRFQISHFNYSESQSSASSVESPDYFFLLTPHLFSYTLLCPHNLSLSLPHSIIVFELCLSIQTNSSPSQSCFLSFHVTNLTPQQHFILLTSLKTQMSHKLKHLLYIH